MKNLLLFFVFLSFSSCCSQSVISKTNREISKNYIKHYNNEIAKNSEKKSFLIRKELIAQGKLRFLIGTDELFILSATDFEEGINIKLIWNKQDEICYSQNRDGFELIDNPFNLDLLQLISNWDVDRIKNDSKQNKYIGGLDIIVRRIKLSRDGKIGKIDYFSFDDYEIN